MNPITKLERSATEWQEAVDAAEGALALDDARVYGLVHGGPPVDRPACLDILADGKRRGFVPAPDAIERFSALLDHPSSDLIV